MLCTMCMHDIDRAKLWGCKCGEVNCSHVDKCGCGRRRPRTFKPKQCDCFYCRKARLQEAKA